MFYLLLCLDENRYFLISEPSSFAFPAIRSYLSRSLFIIIFLTNVCVSTNTSAKREKEEWQKIHCPELHQRGMQNSIYIFSDSWTTANLPSCQISMEFIQSCLLNFNCARETLCRRSADDMTWRGFEKKRKDFYSWLNASMVKIHFHSIQRGMCQSIMSMLQFMFVSCHA